MHDAHARTFMVRGTGEGKEEATNEHEGTKAAKVVVLRELIPYPPTAT